MQYSCKTIQAEAGKKKVGSYNIDLSKRIGSGQFSSVYEALNIENKRLVAAKIINKKTCTYIA
jgi:hypothetical protein